jgi:hypothetical protein
MNDTEEEIDYSGLTLSEKLTLNFYQWEKRGRGWQVWDASVELEPPFVPFTFDPRFFPPAVDDGQYPSFTVKLLKGAWKRLRGLLKAEGNGGLVPLEEDDYENGAVIFLDDSPLHELILSPVSQQKVERENAERFLLALKYCSLPMGFEIIGNKESILVQVVCRGPDLRQVRRQLKAYFPDLVLYEEGETLRRLWDLTRHTVIIDFGLNNEFMRPLRTFKNFDPDPLTGIIGAMEDLEKNELAMFQVLFQESHSPWPQNILRSVTDWQGHSFFVDSPEMVHLAEEKVGKPLFAAVIKVVGQSFSSVRAWEIARAVGSGLTMVANPQVNELIPLTNENYDDLLHADDVFNRETHRSGMLLNSEELVALVHPPSISVWSPKLRRELKKTKAPPSTASGHQIVLGENIHQGRRTTVTISPEQRFRHMHIIGATGTGKSTLLLQLIVQDITQSSGIGVLDPHGDLIDRILGYIPEDRFDDVILLDPADMDYPIGLNILSSYSELDKTVLASDLIGVFRRLSTSWGDQMNSIFGNAILAFLESETGGTLGDLRRFLVEKEYRDRFLQTVRDREVLYYWQKEFPVLTGKVQAPILTRLDTFLRPKPIRVMVNQKEGLNFQEIVDGRKIFLAKLAQGLIGMENAYLLGSIIVSKLHQAAMARQAKLEREREGFYLFVDEFQNFATESMTEILSGARKYNFGLVLAHQEMQQLMSRNRDLANSVISNPGTRICFRLGDFDAKKLEEGFSFFDFSDLLNLGIGEAIVRIERADHDFNIKTMVPPQIDPEVARRRREQVINRCREKYAVSRAQLEEALEKEREWVKPPTEKVFKEIIHEIKEPLPSPVVEKVEVEYPELEGKGGREHRYLQHFIKKAGEENGFRAIIEQPTPSGEGSIDVTLERNGKKIACEISITSSEEYELGNIKKCLEAGYETIVFLSPYERNVKKVKELVSKEICDSDQKRIVCFQTKEEVALFIKSEAGKMVTKEEVIKGYKVKRVDKPVTKEKGKSISKTMSDVFISSYRRLKKEK